jgi:hypothetical protein
LGKAVFPLNRPAATFSPTEGEGWDEGARMFPNTPLFRRIYDFYRTIQSLPNTILFLAESAISSLNGAP